MAKTYDPADLATSDVYKVRLAVGDWERAPNETYMVLDDAEILFVISQNPSDLRAAAIGTLDLICITLAKAVSYSKGKVSEQASQRYSQFDAERRRLRSGGALFGSGTGVPSGILYGGIIVTDVDQRRNDNSVVQPNFDRNSADNHPGNPSDMGADYTD